MSMVKQITVSTNKIYQLAFHKEAASNCSLKGAMADSFCRVPCSMPSVSTKSVKLKCLSKLL